MCEFTPPYFVTKPMIPFEKIQSNPGSALSINKIVSF